MEDSKQLLQDKLTPFGVLSYSIHAAIKNRNLNPLIRGLERVLATSNQLSLDSNTIFSCDSFCEPHLQSQLRLHKALKDIGKSKLNFFNIPISHYITSLPDINILKLANHPTRLLEGNNQLLEVQPSYLSLVLEDERLPSAPEKLFSLSQKFELLIDVLEDHDWESININHFPFHELSHRDLSLTYKAIPELSTDSSKPFYSHYVLSNKFNLWLLCILACESQIGMFCYCMSFYTASTVFMYFCSETGRSLRYFGPSGLDLQEFGLDQSAHMCIAESPNSIIALTRASVTSELSNIEISHKARQRILSIIDKRLDGAGSHTYSSGVSEKGSSWSDYNNWIQEERSLGKQIISLFTSSPDELIGQQLSYKHLNADLSHLPTSVFRDQEHWLETTIRYFLDRQVDTSLIIRLHPRLGADKRGLLESPYLKNMWDLLNQLIGSSQAIRIVHPSDPISSYWLGFQSDLILNGWSTIGMEFAIKGKIVTNAFYKCPLGGGAVYPLHITTPPLLSTNDYLNRVNRLIETIKSSGSINKEDIISPEEAIKAFIAASTAGLVNLDDANQLHCQLASSMVLTPLMISLMKD